MQELDSTIHHVSDTALWVAHYRAEETRRQDALFQDPYAEKLAGGRGRKIAESMGHTSRYTAWNLAIRTRAIDELLLKLLSEGVDLVLNLGAGLDSRPYRMELPASLQWIEVDHPHMIDYKERLLAGEKPCCRLERIRLDLSDRGQRPELFASVAARGKKILVITEGVIPYLSVEAVAELAEDLHACGSFQYWIAEYFSPYVYRYFRNPKRMQQLKNAPFRFFPADWFGFFRTHGWVPRESRYMAEESLRWGRKIPAPWWVIFLRPFLSRERKQAFLKMNAYVLYQRQ